MLHTPNITKLGLALAAALMLGAAPSALMAATPADTLVIADAIDDIISFDPAEAFEFSGTDTTNNLYDSLVELDPTKPGELVPGLAESWSVAEDGVTYTFTMRPGVSFSSGNPVRAEDAAYSIRRVVMLNKNPAFILTQFGLTPENVEQNVRVEDGKLIIVTDKPYAPSFFYNCLTAQVGGIVDELTVSQHDVNGDMGNEWLKSNSAGTGAYVLKSFKALEGYVLEAREGHWRGDATLKRVFMRHVPETATQRLLLEKGDIDIGREVSTIDSPALAANPALKLQEDVAGYVFYLSLNQKVEPLNNPAVQEAMRWLVDYEGMTNSFLKGQFMVHQSFLPQGYLGAIDDTPYKLDVEKAKQIMADAGVAPFTVTLNVRNRQDIMDMAQSIQNTFGQAGITVELQVATGKEVLELYRARQHGITIQNWGPDYPDPHTNASTFALNTDNSDEAKLTGSLAWRNAWDPAELNAMTMAAVEERDTDKRRALYEDIQRRHQANSAFVTMFQSINQTVMQANVSGFYTGGSTDSASYWLVTK
ncbi:ABC transporter substrate-binding protein [Rhodobacter veldkampii DSM 11550]|uniref:ABC transporter substrate-binding protein n=1 Tax=Phaeovulum veldkampii DSM 11550 TaxID=1185920 RepID=A0A2T4JIV7_9RHOB|nr:ABC transporter substrate-binding protein [Phaeovulum veldkampii]MBK5947622.1 ABC transporter substrate-binding protein [Phaeovulum veldkampii DSM 11550]NCU20094.1 ABC transporter substrate-binding protein [Candidatus Falkowbacteria bacterium]PTE17727.1 ABC transporter substrate-binding protein [Phaeovulum veldkampii DSM 11550]TDQ58205.1 peptide/nickel transport system substrate-binding protein [Phaeovulum veldkampii DSM 11550]